MKKTKRTLLISSLIMALTLVVTIVSVSAAWFSNSTSTKSDGFLIGSDTVTEYASIKIDSTVTDKEGGYDIWPAKMQAGWLLNHNGASVVAPTGSILKNANSTIGVTTGARCAKVYFPITFVGAGDTGYADGNKSLKLSLASVRIDEYTVLNKDDNSKVDSFTDFREDFLVEMSIVSVVKNDDGSFTISPYVNSDIASLDSEEIFYSQPTVDGEPSYDLYMAVDSAVEYYVEAIVYFNKVDEEVNPELLYTEIYLNFAIDFTITRNDLLTAVGGSAS